VANLSEDKPLPIEWCRRCRDLDQPPLPAEFVVWGRYFPEDARGPRCRRHLHQSIRVEQVSQYAVLDLRGLVRR